jgi:hypothetical protein
MPDEKEPIPQFAKRIKQKYPQYKDVDDTELVNKMIEKYPEYRDRVQLEPVKKKDQSIASLGASILQQSVSGSGVPST